jgi:RNAse (barnase) inhibitor barstar
MKTPMVKIDTTKITDWDTFHTVFAEALGFPGFYGRNMNAWIDCLTSLDEPLDGMTKIHAAPNGVLLLHLDKVRDFRQRCPEQYAALIECAAFVNYRRMAVDEEPVLALSFWESNPNDLESATTSS